MVELSKLIYFNVCPKILLLSRRDFLTYKRNKFTKKKISDIYSAVVF